MRSPEPIGPVNPLPPVVLAVFLAMLAVEAAFQLGLRGIVGGPAAIGWRSTAIQGFGVNAEILRWMVENRQFPQEHLLRFLTFPFVHGTFTHMIFAGAMFLALGKFVGEVFSHGATLALFLGASVAGALAFGLLAGPGQPWLVGAFPGVYGLIGGFTYLMWRKLGQSGAPQARAFSLIGVLLLLQLLFGLLFGGNSEWLADLGGFLFGFGASFVLAPGGWARMRARIRHQ